jgi:hypothetical protein
VPHEHLDNVAQRQLAVCQGSFLVDQGGAQDRLQRPHQATLGLAGMGGDRLGAEQHAPILVVEEHRAGHQRPAVFDWRKHGGMTTRHPDCRVRCAEIQSAGDHGCPLQARRGSHLLDSAGRCQTVCFCLNWRWIVGCPGAGRPFLFGCGAAYEAA